jgi:predicted DNA-binding protein (UPF0251 family)
MNDQEDVVMDSEEPEKNLCPRRGRPRVKRIIEGQGESRCYEPCCCPGEERDGILLDPEEIELIRLIDLEGLEQEAAAEKLGVSRKTVWRDIHETRRKITDALVNGKGIKMAGCTKAAEGRCPKCPR